MIRAWVQLPPSNVHADYVGLINQLPSQDTPSLFGLPSNSDVAVQTRNATHVQESLQQLSADTEGKGKFDRDKWAAALSPLLSLWAQLAQKCEPVKQAQTARPNAQGASPVDTIIALEIGKARALLTHSRQPLPFSRQPPAMSCQPLVGQPSPISRRPSERMA